MRRQHLTPVLSRFLAMVLAMAGVGLAAPMVFHTASAAEGDVGFADFQYREPYTGSNPDVSPTASKPQSKLWYAQGRWWGALMNRTTRKFHILAYNAADHTWSDTGVPADARDGVDQVDVLWSDGTLYVAGHSRSDDAVFVQVSEFTYSGGTWVPGATRKVNSVATEAAVIAKDTKDRLWVAYTSSSQVRLKVQGFDHSFSDPYFVPPVDGTGVTADDIASIIAHGGKISVVWSNQRADADGNSSLYVATHPDSQAPQTGWSTAVKAFSGPRFADDHVNVQSAEGAGGSVYVVAKTNKASNDPASDPLIVLLVLRPDGSWQSHTHSTVAERLTRPIVVLEPGANKLHVFAGPEGGGTIYRKTSAMDNISFAPGRGEPFIKLAAHPKINNPTASKQSVTGASGLLVLATDATTGYYVHNHVPGPQLPAAPKADFSYTPRSGTAPLTVSFTDTSTGSPTSWAWEFGDGTTSTAQNPSHTYTKAGTYTVKLVASNPGGSSTKTGTVPVTAAQPPTGFTFDRLAGENRYGTAAAIARQTYRGSSAEHVLLANGANFPDALAGSYLAGLVDAPVLLTRSRTVPAVTRSALTDLGAKTVQIVGGTSVVSAGIATDLRNAGYTVRRIAGDDRYETAADIATSQGKGVVGRVGGRATAVLASGENFPDALSAGPLSAARSLPLLLTRRSVLPKATTDALKGLGVQHVLVVGGSGVVSRSVAATLRHAGLSVERLAGDNRAETAVKVADFAVAELGFGKAHVNLARGDEFADALAGGPHAGREAAPVLLTRSPTQNAPETLRWLTDHAGSLRSGHVLGGTGAVANPVVREAEERVS